MVRGLARGTEGQAFRFEIGVASARAASMQPSS
jgi:hypothetical protein